MRSITTSTTDPDVGDTPVVAFSDVDGTPVVAFSVADGLRIASVEPNSTFWYGVGEIPPFLSKDLIWVSTREVAGGTYAVHGMGLCVQFILTTKANFIDLTNINNIQIISQRITSLKDNATDPLAKAEYTQIEQDFHSTFYVDRGRAMRRSKMSVDIRLGAFLCKHKFFVSSVVIDGWYCDTTPTFHMEYMFCNQLQKLKYNKAMKHNGTGEYDPVSPTESLRILEYISQKPSTGTVRRAPRADPVPGTRYPKKFLSIFPWWRPKSRRNK